MKCKSCHREIKTFLYIESKYNVGMHCPHCGKWIKWISPDSVQFVEVQRGLKQRVPSNFHISKNEP